MSTAIHTRTYTIALAGQPNTGKSTVFNRLVGARQHVGNWPGKTVEKKRGDFRYENRTYSVVDLPGTYSLTANSMEEIITRDFLVKEKPDAVVVLADAAQLERSLYLLTEIRLLPVPVILALNMMDVAEARGRKIDAASLQDALGVPVVPMVAAKGQGLDLLMDRVAGIAQEEPSQVDLCMKEGELTEKYDELRRLVSDQLPSEWSVEWLLVKLLEGESEARETVRRMVSSDTWADIQRILEKTPDGALDVADSRYAWIQTAMAASVQDTEDRAVARKRSRFDRTAIHPVWGKFIAVGIMILAFAGAMIVAMPLMGIAQVGLPALADWFRSLFLDSSPWFASLLADGLVPGIGVALLMLFYIFGVYLVFGILEDIGYLARLAFVFDRTMNRIGLHGKSFMPMLMSFGCNIAGVTGTRIVDSWRQRMVTLVMVSIIPCMAMWAVVSFMGVIFFGPVMPVLVLSLLVVMFLHLMFTSTMLRKFVLKGEESGLIMELPPYHKPNWKTIWGYVWNQLKGFLKRAFTLITLVSLLIWALSYQPDGNMENSILAAIGKFFDPVSGLMGLDWKLFVALIAAVVAKEASLAVIAVLYGIGQGVMSITSLIFAGGGMYEESALVGAVAQAVTPASALAFIFAFFFSIPCLGTVATIYSETKSLRWTIGCALYYTLSSFVFGVIAYHAGLLIL